MSSTPWAGRSRRALPFIAAVTAALVVVAWSVSLASASTRAAHAAKGSTVSIMVESAVNTDIGSYPGEWGAAQAAALAINKAGGINGHPLKVVLCNDQFTVPGATACAREAVADHVIAYTGFSPFAFAVSPILKTAKITFSPWASAITDDENPQMFTLAGTSSINEQLGTAELAKTVGAKSVVITEEEFPGLAETIKVQEQELKHLHIKVLGVITTTDTQADFSAPVQQMVSLHPDAILLNTSGNQIAGMLQTAQGLGFSPKWLSAASPFEVQSLKVAAGLTSRLYLSSVTPAFQAPGKSSIPAVNQYNSEMNAAVSAGDSNAAAGNRDGSAFEIWATVHGLAQIGDTVKGSLTAASFAKARVHTHSLDVVGLWNWSPNATGSIKLLPHVTDGGLCYLGHITSAGTMKILSRPPVLTDGGLG